jgi:tetratricopeptide (TPR) repeat protein
VAAALAICAAAQADSVKVKGMPYDSVTITAVADGQITFRTSAGALVTKPLKDVASINLAGDPAFTKAEGLLADKKFAEAAAAYATASGGDAWKKTLLSCRLLAANDQAGRIDEAAKAWIDLLSVSAGAATLAMKPVTLGEKGSAANDKAIALVKTAADAAKNADARNALRGLLADLYERQGKIDEASAIAKTLVGETPTSRPTAGTGTGTVGTPTGTGATSTPAVAPAPTGASAAAALRMAKLNMDKGDLAGAISQIEPRLNDCTRAELPQALYVLGRCQLDLARTDGDADHARDTCVRAGLNLMRVAVFFPDHEYAADALLRAGLANEGLKNVTAARSAYSGVVSRYAASPQAKDAATALERMKNAPAAPAKAPAPK